MRTSKNKTKDVSDRNADLKTTNFNLNNKNDQLKKQIELLNMEKEKTVDKCSQLEINVEKWKVRPLLIITDHIIRINRH